MLVNGCISTKDLKNILDDSKSIKTIENRHSLKRHLPSSSSVSGLSVSTGNGTAGSSTGCDSTYGSDSEEGSEHADGKPARKRANLDHLSSEEKLMRRKLKNRVAAQTARDKKRVKMEGMEAELRRLKVRS